MTLSFRSREWSVHRGAASGACFLRLNDVLLQGRHQLLSLDVRSFVSAMQGGPLR
ncbi:hypothetical protein K503DRAFT_396698 [Rhizopogon vinicolor AM-OR11-026]|uniref:Uncharacterized protein n=1 Tax=Rhizopogon vinicolor AM-OR11-026 TaxID=1314800 RepID=A0A1B7MR86_9AGAM|nr:hypothetical protein K503DRAFT_396698 [Rhizopogon vinicolor AM-OR11-026]